VALALPAAAQATISLSASSSPSSVTGPAPWTGSYELTIESGDMPAQVQVYVSDGNSGIARIGLGLSVSGAAKVDGQQVSTAFGPVFPDPYSPGGEGPCDDHGSREGGFTAVDVSLPANSTGTVAATQVLASAPWPGDTLALRFLVNPVAVPPGTETVPATQTIRLAGPKLDVARGVKIDFTSPRPRTPRGDPDARPRTTQVRVGRRVLIRGTTTPAIRGQVLKLVERSSPDARPKPIGRVVVGRGGRFSFGSWEPSSAGTHLIDATYRPQRLSLANSRTRCGPIVLAG
jgi:hypothetical protein